MGRAPNGEPCSTGSYPDGKAGRADSRSRRRTPPCLGSPAGNRLAARGTHRGVKVTTLVTPEGLPEVGQAAALGLAVMRFAHVERWDQLGTILPGGLRLDDEQREILERNSGILALLRAPVKIDRTRQQTPTVTLEVCLECERWIVAASRSSPAGHSCRANVGCQGRTRRATPAAKLDVLAPDPGSEPYRDQERQLQPVED